MKWEHTKAGDFDKILEQCGYTCIVPIGSLEPHGHHMPVGTDYFTAKAFAEQAAEIEPCMVFPAMYFGAVYESAAMKGAVNLRPDLLIQLYFNIFDEIARNGFSKILIVNAHGGNSALLSLLNRATYYNKKDYALVWTGVCDPKVIRPESMYPIVMDRIQDFPYLTEADLEAIKAAGLPIITPMVICNTDYYPTFNTVVGKEVTNDDVVIELAK